MKSKRGGYRKGAGAKLKYGEETTTVSFRLPMSLIPEIKEIVKLKLKKYESKGKG
jgi:hypothetical protein